MESEVEKVVEGKDGLSFQDLLHIIRKHLLVILITIVVFTVVGFGYAKFKQSKSPQYIARSSMMVSVEGQSNSGNLSDYQNYQLSQYLINTYIVYLSQDSVVSATIDKLYAADHPELRDQEKITITTIKRNFKAEISGSSLILDLTYTSNSPEKANLILNTLMETVIEKANEIVIDADGKPKPVNKFLYENIVILNKANKDNITPVSSTLKYMVIFFAAGVVLAFLYVFIRELTDNKFKNSEEVEKVLGLPVLSGIPEYSLDKIGE